MTAHNFMAEAIPKAKLLGLKAKAGGQNNAWSKCHDVKYYIFGLSQLPSLSEAIKLSLNVDATSAPASSSLLRQRWLRMHFEE